MNDDPPAHIDNSETSSGEDRALFELLLQIVKRVQSLPDLDTRSPEEILGYDDPP